MDSNWFKFNVHLIMLIQVSHWMSTTNAIESYKDISSTSQMNETLAEIKLFNNNSDNESLNVNKSEISINISTEVSREEPLVSYEPTQVSVISENSSLEYDLDNSSLQLMDNNVTNPSNQSAILDVNATSTTTYTEIAITAKSPESETTTSGLLTEKSLTTVTSIIGNKRFGEPSDISTMATPEAVPDNTDPEIGENLASRVACMIDGSLTCLELLPTCYGSGKIDCGAKKSVSSVNRKRSTGSRFRQDGDPPAESETESSDLCELSGDIICSPVATKSNCQGKAECNFEKMEETIGGYNYWQILLIAGAAAIIAVTIIIVGVVSYISWSKYKVRPDAENRSQQSSSNKV